MFIWLLYCLAEIANPTGLLEAWLLSRSLILNGFLISLIISLVITKNGQVRWIITLLSIFSLSAALKAFAQKYIGFDYGELQWLNNGGALTHIIGYGTRYFSFFTDAGNFGSNMGCASLLFALMAIYVSKIGQRIYYFSVAIICLIAMFMSGTRGAMIAYEQEPQGLHPRRVIANLSLCIFRFHDDRSKQRDDTKDADRIHSL